MLVFPKIKRSFWPPSVTRGMRQTEPEFTLGVIGECHGRTKKEGKTNVPLRILQGLEN